MSAFEGVANGLKILLVAAILIIACVFSCRALG